MKRDLNKCRDLLLSIEKGKSSTKSNIPENLDRFHANLLYDAGLINDKYTLTMKGYDVLYLIRDDDTWDYIMLASDSVGGLPFDMILEYAKKLLTRKVDKVVKNKQTTETQNYNSSFQPYIDAVNKITKIFSSAKSDTIPFLPSSSYDEPLGINLIDIEKLVYINKDYPVALLELMKYVQREGNLYIIGENHKSKFVNNLLRTILEGYDKKLSNDEILVHKDLVHVYKLIKHNQFGLALSELNRYMVETGYIEKVYEMPNSLAKSVLSLHNLIVVNLNNPQVVQNKEADNDSG